MLDEAEARRRFTHLHIDGPALFQPDGAVILAADALAAFRTVAGGCGATFVDDDEVTAIRPLAGDAGVVVETASGTMVHASVAIVTTGAWAESVLRGLATLPAITVTCERVGFFRPRQPVATLPTFIDHSPTGPPVYGLATPEGLVKVAEHGTGPIVDPDAREREPDGTRWPVLLDWVAHSLPGVDPEPVGSTTCLYASTADDRFVLDRAGPVVVGVGLGGHGFKFLPSIGERLADLADGVTLDANPFALADPS
jgi:sarcosine oxidase